MTSAPTQRRPAITWFDNQDFPIPIEFSATLVEQLFIFIHADIERARLMVRNIGIDVGKRKVRIGTVTYQMLCVYETMPGHYDGEYRTGLDALAGGEAGMGFQRWKEFVGFLDTFPYGDGVYIYNGGGRNFNTYLDSQGWNIHFVKYELGLHHWDTLRIHYYKLHAEPGLRYGRLHQKDFPILP